MTLHIWVFALLLLISPSVFAQASDPEELLPIIQNGKMGYISKKGEIVIRPRFDVSSFGVPQFSEFSEGMAAIKSQGLIGYIDS